MEFLWPAALWGLAALAGLAAAFWRQSRRRARQAWSHPWAAGVAWPPPRRNLAAFLYVGALGAVGLAVARPTLPLRVPVREAVVVLSIDVSGSMRSQDMLPNRLEAAREAARVFIRGLS
ncbi:MAG: magnesium chelatase, partial [Armatimonadota bacterium]|nr:magnesium chelatase [Armatimonadota bacterium]